MRIRIKHIFILSITLLIVETILSTTYNYKTINHNSQQQANDLMKLILHSRITLVVSAKHSKKNFFNSLHILQKSLANFPSAAIYQTSAALTGAYIIPASTTALSKSTYLAIYKQFIDSHRLLISTYFPTANIWLTFQGNYNTIQYWERAILTLFYNLIIIIILWVGFIFYCRYTLPDEIMRHIIGRNRQHLRYDGMINTLKNQIQAYVEEKNLMISALAHDIKTPLTEALLRLELLDNQSQTAAIKDSLNKIDRIVKSSLEYAKQPEQLKKVSVDLVSLIDTLVEDYQQNGFDIDFHHGASQYVMEIELELFKRLLINLIENAKKYATQCQIDLKKTSDTTLTLQVQDDGPGVPDKDLKLLGIPYFRVDQSRSSMTGGTGLGLAIIKKIAELHRAQVTFANAPGGGFQATIQLPLG